MTTQATNGALNAATLRSASFVRRREAAGFRFTEVQHPEHFVVERHRHEEGYLCLILNGSYDESEGSRGCAVRAATTLVVYPAGSTHNSSSG
jgi:hypothetical protein